MQAGGLRAQRSEVTGGLSGKAMRQERHFGWAASLLATWSQILLVATMALVPPRISSDPLAETPICHADDGNGGTGAPQSPNHSGHDCVLCAICIAHATSAAVLSPAPWLPTPRLVATARHDAYRPRAPPVRAV